MSDDDLEPDLTLDTDADRVTAGTPLEGRVGGIVAGETPGGIAFPGTATR